MIEGKAALLALWLAMLAACCALLFALLISGAQKGWAARLASPAMSAALLVGLAALLLLRALNGPPAPTSPLVLSLAFLTPLLLAGRDGFTALGGLAALPLLATVTWWGLDMALGLPRSLAFLTVGLLAAGLPQASFRVIGVPPLPVLAELLCLGVISAILLGQFGSPVLFWAIWHHWGAPMSPHLKP
jgi:hypothetical protein